MDDIQENPEPLVGRSVLAWRANGRIPVIALRGSLRSDRFCRHFHNSQRDSNTAPLAGFLIDGIDENHVVAHHQRIANHLKLRAIQPDLILS